MQVEIPQLTLRPAQAPDFPAIRALIRKVGINPWELDWRRFTLAVDAAGHILACGQIKPHGNLRELASLAVEPAYQGQGLGTLMMRHLIAMHREDTSAAPSPLYLTCRSSLGPYYTRLGFREVTGDALPRYYRRLQRLVNPLMAATGAGTRLLVMVLNPEMVS